MPLKTNSFAPDFWRPAGKKFGIMGIINLTPDSFFDGGRHASAEAACARAGRMLAAGADIIDLGGESTRPGAPEIGAHLEIRRLEPAFQAIREKFPSAVISIDTWRAATARHFLERGASVVNDVSGFAWDSALLEVLAQFRPAYVLMHGKGRPAVMQADPRYDDVLDETRAFFENSLNRLARVGLPQERIVLDPGIGFGKTLEHNLTLLKNLEAFLEFGLPLLVGVSMKSWLGEALNLPLEDRSRASAAASALLWRKGAFWHRVHEPEAVREALELACLLD